MKIFHSLQVLIYGEACNNIASLTSYYSKDILLSHYTSLKSSDPATKFEEVFL